MKETGWDSIRMKVLYVIQTIGWIVILYWWVKNIAYAEYVEMKALNEGTYGILYGPVGYDVGGVLFSFVYAIFFGFLWWMISGGIFLLIENPIEKIAENHMRRKWSGGLEYRYKEVGGVMVDMWVENKKNKRKKSKVSNSNKRNQSN